MCPRRATELFAAAVLVFARQAGKVSTLLTTRPFLRLGLFSYSIYMVHDLIAYGLALAASVVQRRLGVDLWRDTLVDGVSGRVVDLGHPALGDIAALAYVVAVLGLASLTYRFIENPGRRPVVIIEVQHGRRVEEDDIIRRHDDYGRAGRR